MAQPLSSRGVEGILGGFPLPSNLAHWLPLDKTLGAYLLGTCAGLVYVVFMLLYFVLLC